MRTEDGDRPQGLTRAPENQPLERLREAGKRVTDPLEATAQRIAERAIDLVIHAVDINEFVAQIDLNAALDRIDITRLLERVDLNALLKNVDLNALMRRPGATWLRSVLRATRTFARKGRRAKRRLFQ